MWKAETKEKKSAKGSSGTDPDDLAEHLLKFVMSNGGAMRAFQEEHATDDEQELLQLHEQYADIVEELLDDFSDVQGCTPKQLSRACAILAKKTSRSSQKVSRYIAASSDFPAFRSMMSVGAGRRKSVAVVQGGGMDEEKIRELLEKQMQGQQHDIHAMMALVQSLSQGGGGSALLEQQMSVLKLQQEQVLQERERLAAEIAKMQTLQGADTKSGSGSGGGGSTSTSTSTSKKDDVLDAAAAAAEKQEDAAIELVSLQHDLSTVASLPSHELAAKAQALGIACASGDDDETLRARLLEHIAQKSQQLKASVDVEKARQDEAMQERMQRLKAEREAARTKLASAIAAAESGDVASAVAAAAAAADATGDAHVVPAISAVDSGETDEEKRQKLIQQLQVHPPPLFAALRVTRPRCRRPWRRWTAALVLRRRGRTPRCSRFDCTPFHNLCGVSRGCVHKTYTGSRKAKG